MKCPRCHADLTHTELRKLWAQYRASKRKTLNTSGLKRAKKPTHCKRCDALLPSAREAWVHCLRKSLP